MFLYKGVLVSFHDSWREGVYILKMTKFLDPRQAAFQCNIPGMY